jgi:hypothetical protein
MVLSVAWSSGDVIVGGLSVDSEGGPSDGDAHDYVVAVSGMSMNNPARLGGLKATFSTVLNTLDQATSGSVKISALIAERDA